MAVQKYLASVRSSGRDAGVHRDTHHHQQRRGDRHRDHGQQAEHRGAGHRACDDIDAANRHDRDARTRRRRHHCLQHGNRQHGSRRPHRRGERAPLVLSLQNNAATSSGGSAE